MSSTIHPTAVVEEGCVLGSDVCIGAFAYVGPEVTLGDGCSVHHHATVEGRTCMGAGNAVYPYACIGGRTHDLKYCGGEPGLVIGDNNTFREYVSVHLATSDGDSTVVGDHNLILAYSHVAHDCRIGNHLVMSSHAALGGHVEVGDYANVGWGVGVHQYCRVGDYAMIGAASKVVQDVPPFMIADGNPAEVRTVNRVGLERRGIDSGDIERIRTIYKTLYRQGLNRSQAMDVLKNSTDPEHWTLRSMLEFGAASSRGFA